MPLLQTTTAEGAIKGMILGRAAHELAEQEAAYLQDCVVNQPGFVSRRGALTGMTSLGNNLDSNRPHAVCTVFAPDGTQRIAVLYLKTGATYIEVWAAIYTSAFSFIQKHYVCSTTQLIGDSPTRGYSIHTCPTIDGAMIISVRYGYSTSATRIQRIAKWYGAAPTTSFTATAPTCSITAISNTTLTMSAADITAVGFPGMIIEGVGVVDKVLTSTTLQLKYPHTQPGTGATVPQTRSYHIFENLSVWRSRGKISFSNTAAALTGYGTKFTEAEDRATKSTGGIGAKFLDATTMQRIGELAFTNGVAFGGSDTVTQAMTYTGRSAALKSYILTAGLGGEGSSFYDYHGFTATLLPGAGPTGFLGTPVRAAKGSFFTTYKGFNLSFNALVGLNVLDDAGDQAVSGRMYVHGPRFPEIMDHSSDDGDWGDVVSTKGGDQNGVAIMGGNDCAIFCKSQETFALTGDDPSNFVINKIADDGALSYESVTSYKGSPIWLGKTGIWMYDTSVSEPINLVKDSLGSMWTSWLSTFDANTFTLDAQNERTMYAKCFVYRDYLFVNVGTTSGAGVYTDGVLRSQTPLYLCIHLPTNALSILTNFNFTGFFTVGQKGYTIMPQSGSTTHYIYPLDNFFVQGLSVSDDILTSNSYSSGTLSTSVGPWFHMESRKFDGGDGLWKKSWKQLAVEFNETSTKRMWLETVAGLNTTGLRAVLPYVGTGVFLAARVKFRTRDQYMSFRLYEDIANRPSTLTLGAWQWGYKFARRGAV